MRDQLLEELRQFDKKRIAILDQVERLNPQRVEKRPQPNRWSIRETIEHLVISEDHVLRGLPGIGRLVAEEQSMEAHISYNIALLVMKIHFPVNVPAADMIPTGKIPLPELRRQWDESQQWMCDYVLSVAPEKYTEAVFTHPITGPLTIYQVNRIRDLHFDHHLRQIHRIVDRTR